MIYYTKNVKESFSQMRQLESSHTDGIIIEKTEIPWIVLGTYNNAIDVSLASLYDIIKEPYQGGAQISFVGDITALAVSDNYTQWGEDAVWALIKYFKRKHLVSDKVGNDLMIEDGVRHFKVASHAEWVQNDMYHSGLRVSINTDIDEIRKICTKQSGKHPGRLLDYDITQEDVLQALREAKLLKE